MHTHACTLETCVASNVYTHTHTHTHTRIHTHTHSHSHEAIIARHTTKPTHPRSLWQISATKTSCYWTLGRFVQSDILTHTTHLTTHTQPSRWEFGWSKMKRTVVKQGRRIGTPHLCIIYVSSMNSNASCRNSNASSMHSNASSMYVLHSTDHSNKKTFGREGSLIKWVVGIDDCARIIRKMQHVLH